MASIFRETVRQHLINEGRSPADVHAVLKDLPEVLDTDEHAPMFDKLGISVDQLISDRGGSP